MLAGHGHAVQSPGILIGKVAGLAGFALAIVGAAVFLWRWWRRRLRRYRFNQQRSGTDGQPGPVAQAEDADKTDPVLAGTGAAAVLCTVLAQPSVCGVGWEGKGQPNLALG